MPVHQPVFDPPFNVVRASHVELGVRDLARSRAFYVDCLGLLVSDETDDALYLRGLEERARVDALRGGYVRLPSSWEKSISASASSIRRC